MPAVWKPAGTGSGHPKISGGYEVDQHNNPLPTKSLNRPEQRYQISTTEADTRRAARAVTEYATTVIVQGSLGGYEARPFTGNNYDVNASRTFCDCPDFWRLKESYPAHFIACKHIRMVNAAITAYAPLAVPWGCIKLAEYTDAAIRTIENLCQTGACPATKVHGVWVIVATDAITFGNAYKARMIPPR